MRNLLLTSIAALMPALALTACTQSQTDSGQPDNSQQSSAEQPAAKPTAAEQAKEDSRLSQWFETQFQDGIRRYPVFLAQLGIKERMSELNDPSRAFAKEEVQRTRAALAELQSGFDRNMLSPAMQLSYDLFVQNSKNEIEDDKWWGYSYAFNQMFGAQSFLPTFLKNQHPIDTEADARAYIDRLNAFKPYMDQVIDNSKVSADKGIMPPKFVYDHVMRDIDNITKGAPFEPGQPANLLLDDFTAKIDKAGLDAELQKELTGAANAALLGSVKPAYDNLRIVMSAQKEKASTDDGVWKLPNGGAYYATRLRRMTTTDMTANEIHDLGVSEVARIHVEMRAIMEQVGFEGSLQDFFSYLKTDPKFVYSNDDAGREAYLAKATAIIDTMKGRLDDVFLRKPKAPLDVRRVEPFREKSAGKAFYNRPAPDGSRPGIYYANLYNMKDMPIYQMEALAYHEGIPGHHMQIALSQELTGVPSFQKFGFVTAYSEGWGLYSEYLPKEMGFYNDPYSDFGRLAMEIWRAARLVVDTGIHHKKWTREQAIDYLLENTPNPKGDVVKAIERYIVMPGQATAYKIGMIEILRLREEAKIALGDSFDIREFHNVVLKNGPIPLHQLENEVRSWIKSQL